MTTTNVDTARPVEEVMGQVFQEATASSGLVLGYVGAELGLWECLRAAGPATAAEVASAAGCLERYVREWLLAQAAAGYVVYDGPSERFTLTATVAAVLADEQSPTYLGGVFSLAVGTARDADRLVQAFRNGDGIPAWEQDPARLEGLESLTRGQFEANLVTWITALDGVAETLDRGGTIADVCCGPGVSTVVMARAFPRSSFSGFDYDEGAVAKARARAASAGVADRSRFEVAEADAYPGEGYDLVCVIDALHDLGDPVGTLRHVRSTLAAAGTLMLVEPAAHDRPEDNLASPAGRFYYTGSTVYCLPVSLGQPGRAAIGARPARPSWRPSQNGQSSPASGPSPRRHCRPCTRSGREPAPWRQDVRRHHPEHRPRAITTVLRGRPRRGAPSRPRGRGGVSARLRRVRRVRVRARGHRRAHPGNRRRGGRRAGHRRTPGLWRARRGVRRAEPAHRGRRRSPRS